MQLVSSSRNRLRGHVPQDVLANNVMDQNEASEAVRAPARENRYTSFWYTTLEFCSVVLRVSIGRHHHGEANARYAGSR